MIKTIYEVVYDTYIGYADTIEEASQLHPPKGWCFSKG